MADLDQIEARANAATEGPWTHDRETVAVCTPDTRALVLMDDRNEASQAQSDASFIAHARTDVLWLLARVRELEDALDVLASLADGPALRHWLGSQDVCGDNASVRATSEIHKALHRGSPQADTTIDPNDPDGQSALSVSGGEQTP